MQPKYFQIKQCDVTFKKYMAKSSLLACISLSAALSKSSVAYKNKRMIECMTVTRKILKAALTIPAPPVANGSST